MFLLKYFLKPQKLRFVWPVQNCFRFKFTLYEQMQWSLHKGERQTDDLNEVILQITLKCKEKRFIVDELSTLLKLAPH